MRDAQRSAFDVLGWFFPSGRDHNEQRHNQSGHGGPCAERSGLLPSQAGFSRFESLMLARSRDAQLLGSVGSALIAFGEDDVARHQLLAGLQVLARPLVDAREFRHQVAGLAERRLGLFARGLRSQLGDRLRDVPDVSLTFGIHDSASVPAAT